MNLGIYFSSLRECPPVQSAIDTLNSGLERGSLDDASLFYDSVGSNKAIMKFGCFNSTDLWNFTGTLITTDIESTRSALSIVNKFKVYFYHGWETGNNVFALIDLLNNPSVKTICRNGDDARELNRVTGKKPIGLVENFSLSEILQQVEQ